MAELIAAIATGRIPSGVGIVRLSGEGAVQAAEQVFTPLGGRTLGSYPDRQLAYGAVHDRDGREIDQGLAFCSRAPRSYTGEETAEIQCHGSPMALTMVLEALFAAGARQAGPGEFTKRAFLNGKLDLTQAEAVIDLIDAETPAAVKCAADQLEGALSRRVEAVYQELVDLLAHFHAVLDYPDEDIDPFREELITATLGKSLRDLEELLASYDRGRQLTYGVPCAIIGRPNAGKSSFLNALLGYERAIVTPIPGTTRDTIEARATLGGVLLRLVDTAGLRETQDLVEQLGVARSRSAVEEARLVFLLIDGSQPLTKEDGEAMALAEGAPCCLVIRNKADLPQVVSEEVLGERFSHVCTVSAATGSGMDQVSRMVAELFPAEEGRRGLLTNPRQCEAAGRARESLLRAGDSLAAGYPPDLVLADVEEALAALGELTGRTVREDITDRIFQRFCVGK